MSETETTHGAPSTLTLGQIVLHPDRAGYRSLVADLRRDGFTVCLDVTAVDYLTHPGRSGLPPDIVPERFEVMAVLLSFERRERVRLRVQVPETDPVVSSLYDLHPGSEAMEREVFDMFGIVFEDHPDLTRILMPEDWEGHPLRKDYAVGRIPVQFKGAPGAR
ncbi:MAG: NADH-quinone oxidoreductase subunit C [Actinomycetota bacterium]|jgi:NADH-quinone oxidoreductase subunit C|nr:NADH-quinone oxidoreductase subunit C [Acidimicrobiia bacterium]MDQ3305110.1 NADH-quinone oxidoreductase subunit C [Actinomycetota bacterium]MDQ3354887.1 NADH-quinone oxidoreductase subunit C [Actinomycetota bacterium]